MTGPVKDSEDDVTQNDPEIDAPAGAQGGEPEIEPAALSQSQPDLLPELQPDFQPGLSAVLEAILLVTDQPVPPVVLAHVLAQPTEAVERVLRDLAADYEAHGRGFQLREVAGGWRLYTRPDCAAYVERFVLDGQHAKLSQAALETLAVIAYRQPVTRSRVSAVRGVNVDGVVRTLVARGLVAESGSEPDSGALLYVTTPLMLEKLGLQSLDDLPSLAPMLPDVQDILDEAGAS